MVCVPETDWRTELGLPAEPTDAELLQGLQKLEEWKSAQSLNADLMKEYRRRCYVWVSGLASDATEQEVDEARRERIRKHLASKLGLNETTPLPGVAARFKQTLQELLVELEPARKAASALLGLSDPKDDSNPKDDEADELSALLWAWNSVNRAIHWRAEELDRLEAGIVDWSLDDSEYWLEKVGGIRWPTFRFPP